MKLHFSLLKQLLILRFFFLVSSYLGKSFLIGELDTYHLVLYIRKKDFVTVCSFLKHHWFSKFQQVTELVCVDYPKNVNRFELLYFFLSYRYNHRVVCRILGQSGDILPSLSALFAGLSWQEREVWDLFGIPFLNHPDLRRILTDYGFLGHPLRKDFPVSGFVEVYFDDKTQLVGYHPLSLAQEFRDFGQFTNPWILTNK